MDKQEKNSSQNSTQAFAGDSSSIVTAKDSHLRDSSDEIQESNEARSNTTTAPRKLSVQFGTQGKPLVAVSKRASFFKPASPPKVWTWKTFKGLLYGSTAKDVPSAKLALFDMDGTLIVNRLGRRVSDWEFFDASVPIKLKSLSAEGFRIVIISNQLGVSLGVVGADSLQKKIEQFVAAAGVECTAMLATKKDNFRKPETGCWDFIKNSLNFTMPIDMAQCVGLLLTQFFVGDSAGRSYAPGRSKDQSDDDIMFAQNIKVRFFTPEEFFLGTDNSGLKGPDPQKPPPQVSLPPDDQTSL